jgi:membrane protein implicated in regulation of membrane protease activity
MRRLLPVLVLLLGVGLLTPVVQVIWFIASNYTIGVGIDFTFWGLGFGALCAVLGVIAIVWSIAKLVAKRDHSAS